jgi:16S rRNA (guanine527-N7)-methyltransferase
MAVTLIESDQRKAAFLRAALRETETRSTVLVQRIESAAPQRADTVSARALANLDTLLHYGFRHLSKDGTALFQKGANWRKEVIEARQNWHFDLEPITSMTDASAVILRIRNIERA